jgi:glycosyltransferase involved in cell wall biosynthesis
VPHIAIDCRLMHFRKAGITQYTRRLTRALRALDAPDLQLSVLLDRRDADRGWVPDGVRIIDIFTPAHNRFEALTLPIELAARNIDVLHFPDFIACAGRFKKVITIHDLYFMEHPDVLGADGARYYRQTGGSAWRADHIIAVSAFTAADIARLLPGAAVKTSVIHEAADTAVEITPPASARSYALFVGTFEPRKNLGVLLRALGRTHPDITLTIAGENGWSERDPQTDAQRLRLGERVRFAGRVSDAGLDRLLRGARMLVFPSLSEGFGLPMLEAMARGVPVVCGDSGALPEIAGGAALMHDPADDAQLAAHIETLWFDDATHWAWSARGLTRARMFSWERAALETAQVYRKAVGAPVSRP